MVFKPELTITTNVDGTHTLAMKYYSRLAQTYIEQEIERMVHEGIQKVFMEDYEFRNMIADCIKSEIMSLPVETIKNAVKEALRENGTR